MSRRDVLLVAVSLIVGILLGIVGAQKFFMEDRTVLRERSDEFQFISPLLLADAGGDEKIGEYQALKMRVASRSDALIKEGKVQEISIYFRNLNKGEWFGINADGEYSPSSLLKVAVLLSHLRALESDPQLAHENVFVKPTGVDFNTVQAYSPKNPVVPGRTYSAQELIRAMIVESDNNATGLVSQLVGEGQAEKIYIDLGITFGPKEDLDFLSARSYSRFFRVLYNSTYLSHHASEEALRLLSQTDFKKGLVAGVPPSTTVAHKFGERTVTDEDKHVIVRELHDCGIVYHSPNPYILCVMTKGKEFTDLETVIANISALVWEWEERHNR